MNYEKIASYPSSLFFLPVSLSYLSLCFCFLRARALSLSRNLRVYILALP
jgi:hypothetical protein